VEVLAVGVDLTEIERVQRLLTRHPRFAERCFTGREREYAFAGARPAERLAARFAAKEAVMKSLGSGWRDIGWREVEITGGGMPRVLLTGRARARASELGVGEVLVSLTHTRETAAAVALAVVSGAGL
jgi:holo-[acyl-carrier protein] synthase